MPEHPIKRHDIRGSLKASMRLQEQSIPVITTSMVAYAAEVWDNSGALEKNECWDVDSVAAEA